MRYKNAEVSGYYYKIDADGNKSASFNEGKPGTMGAGFYAEMQEWLKIPGNEIEPQYTPEELIEKEAKEAEQALSSQKSEAQRLLDDSDKKILPDWPYQDDVSQWLTFRAELRLIIKSEVLETIPEKPFQL